MTVEVCPLSPGLGAEIRGVNLATITESDFERVYRAFLDHMVLVVRDQHFATIPDFLRYSRRFGRPTPHAVKRTRHPDYPELTVMGQNTVKSDGSVNTAVVKRGEGWHTDTAFLAVPAKATQLYALEIPSYGGDTLFASMYAAYDALPEDTKRRIAQLGTVYCCGGKEKATNDLLDDEERNRAPVVHPMVRVHPETGRTFLYVNPTHALGVADMDATAGDALLQDLYARMVQPGHDYRHQWRVGDVVIWDNRCCIHSAAGGYPLSERRIHWRTTIMADGVREQPPGARIAA